MDPQLVDWGGSAVLLGIFWQLVAWSMRRLTRRLDRQDEDLAELKTDVAELRTDMAGLDGKVSGLDAKVTGLAEGQARTDGNILRIVGDLGEVKGELKRIAPREKVTAEAS